MTSLRRAARRMMRGRPVLRRKRRRTQKQDIMNVVGRAKGKPEGDRWDEGVRWPNSSNEVGERLAPDPAERRRPVPGRNFRKEI